MVGPGLSDEERKAALERGPFHFTHKNVWVGVGLVFLLAVFGSVRMRRSAAAGTVIHGMRRGFIEPSRPDRPVNRDRAIPLYGWTAESTVRHEELCDGPATRPLRPRSNAEPASPVSWLSGDPGQRHAHADCASYEQGGHNTAPDDEEPDHGTS